MMSNILKIFKRKKDFSFDFDVKNATIPESFGYPETQFGLLVNDLTIVLVPEDRLGSLDAYLRGPMFKQRNMDLSNPKHALVLGYAFSTAVFMQRELQQKVAVNKVLEAFYPEVKGSKTIHG